MPFLFDDEEDRPLIPLRMRNANDRAFGNRRMCDTDILKFDRADPLTARFDHVFRTVDNAHRAGPVDRGDVAGIEPAIEPSATIVMFVISARDPGPAHEEAPEGSPIMRQLLAVRADDFEFDAKHRPALLSLKLIA